MKLKVGGRVPSGNSTYHKMNEIYKDACKLYEESDKSDDDKLILFGAIVANLPQVSE